jgi:hypothetical protein
VGILLGLDEKIRCIAPTNIKDANDTGLCLAHKTTAHMLGGGIYLTDDGYVLAIGPTNGAEASSYYDLTAQDISTYQAQGLLPTPLPEYAVSVRDYVWGYSLWPILIGSVIWGLYSTRHLKRTPNGSDGADAV